MAISYSKKEVTTVVRTQSTVAVFPDRYNGAKDKAYGTTALYQFESGQMVNSLSEDDVNMLIPFHAVSTVLSASNTEQIQKPDPRYCDDSGGGDGDCETVFEDTLDFESHEYDGLVITEASAGVPVPSLSYSCSYTLTVGNKTLKNGVAREDGDFVIIQFGTDEDPLAAVNWDGGAIDIIVLNGGVGSQHVVLKACNCDDEGGAPDNAPAN